MTLSRRGAIKATGAIAGLDVVSGRVFVVGEHEADDRKPRADAGSPGTALRVAHLSPGAPTVDVLLDGERTDDRRLATVDVRDR